MGNQLDLKLQTAQIAREYLLYDDSPTRVVRIILSKNSLEIICFHVDQSITSRIQLVPLFNDVWISLGNFVVEEGLPLSSSAASFISGVENSSFQIDIVINGQTYKAVLKISPHESPPKFHMHLIENIEDSEFEITYAMVKSLFQILKRLIDSYSTKHPGTGAKLFNDS